jgi:hypothetical protein
MCSRKGVNKTEEHNIYTYETKLGNKITLNREQSTKLIQKNSLPSTAHESQFSDKQKFHRASKQRRPVSTEVLSNWPFILWLQTTASCAWSFTFLSSECSTSWHEIMHLTISGDLPILGDFPLLKATADLNCSPTFPFCLISVSITKKTN